MQPLPIAFSGRSFAEAEIELIREIVRDFSNLSLTGLSKTHCELLEWKRPTENSSTKNVALFSNISGIRAFWLCPASGPHERSGRAALLPLRRATLRPPLQEAPVISIP